MRHFGFLSDEQASLVFHTLPQRLELDSPAPLLAVALGATLYCPGTRPGLVAAVHKQAARGCLSMVLCLEDSVADDEVEQAEDAVVAALLELRAEQVSAARAVARGADPDDVAPAVPMLFVRVRTPEQMASVAERAGDALDVLSGFVIPKFENQSGYADRFFAVLHEIHERFDQAGGDGRRRLRVMPILESPVMIHAETRASALEGITAVLDRNRDDVLAVRIGATDLASVFGLRRSRDLTIYDVGVVASVIADIVNVLGRRERAFVISGPVWEHYVNTERMLRPQLRMTPFVEADDMQLRKELLLSNFDGLLREIALDQANGITGKTVIHPTHVALVHAMSVVSHEEFLDAQAVVGRRGGGAVASPYGNKMNEMKPHTAWAERTLLRAAAFGVALEGVTFVDLLEASMRETSLTPAGGAA